MRRFNKALAAILSLVLIIGCLPVAALAQEPAKATISYSEDFSNGAPNWTLAKADQADRWSTEGGKLTASWNELDLGGDYYNSYISYTGEGSADWAEYTASTDISLYRYTEVGGAEMEEKIYPQAALCVYSVGGERVEIRVTATSTGWRIRMYKRDANGNGWATSNAPDIAYEGGQAWGDTTLSLNLKVVIADGKISAYVNDTFAIDLDLSAIALTKGSIGLFPMRGSQSTDAELKIEFDNVKVEKKAAGSTEPEQPEQPEQPSTDEPWKDIESFVGANDWEFESADSSTGAVNNGVIEMTMDGSKDSYTGTAYTNAAAVEWSNYNYSADVTVNDPSGQGKYSRATLRIYSQGNTWSSQNYGCYEYLVDVTGVNSYAILVRKIYNDNGSRKVVELTSAGYISNISNAVEGKPNTAKFNLAVQVENGLLVGYINGGKAVTCNLAEKDTYGEIYTKGSIGVNFLRLSASKVDGYICNLENVKISAPWEVPEDLKPGEGVEQIPSNAKNDENFIIIENDSFDYVNGDKGSWLLGADHTGILDKVQGDWSINNGLMINTNDGNTSNDNSIALSDGLLHKFGSVSVDVMITSLQGSNVYTGIVAAYHGGANYYHLRLADLANGGNQLQLYRMKGGATKLEAVDLPFTIERNKWYTLRLDFIDGVLIGYVDGVKYIEHNTAGEETVYTEGSMGVRTTQGSAIFDNFIVRIPRVEATVKEDFNNITNLEDTQWDDNQSDKSKGQWSVKDGVLVQAKDDGATETYILLLENGQDITFGGASMDVRFTSAASDARNLYAGPVVSYNGDRNYYHLRLADMKSGNDQVQLFRMDAGSAKKLLGVDLGFEVEKDVWYNIEMFQYGNVIYGYVNGVLMLTHEVEEIEYPSGLVGIRISQGSAEVDNFIAYGESKAAAADKVIVNDTVVENPDTFTDNFEDETVGTSPNFWLENNNTEYWHVVDLNGNKVYGMDVAGKDTHSWLHVFETNVYAKAKMYVSSDSIPANAKAGIMLRKTALYTVAWVEAGYDFAQQKWYIFDDKGEDFESQTIYAKETSTFTLDAWHTVEAKAVDSKVQIWCDGVLVLESDVIQQVTTGRVGFYTNGAKVFVDDVEVQLLSGQGRIEEAVIESFMVDPESLVEGASIYPYFDGKQEVLLLCHRETIYISYDEGHTWERCTATHIGETAYKFFQSPSYQNIVLTHAGHYVKRIGNNTSGTVWIFKDGVVTELKNAMWTFDSANKVSNFYGGMNDMMKEINLGDIDGDGKDNYRIFYCADVRGYGGTSSIIYHWEEVYFSDDGGYTWKSSKFDTRLVTGLDHHVESRIMYDPVEKVLRMYCPWNRTDKFHILISRDFGETWGEEYTIPYLSVSRSSFNYVVDPDTGYIYMCFCFVDPDMENSNSVSYLRNRFVLVRSKDGGKSWEFIMDLYRWNDVPTDRMNFINQIVDPAITIIGDYIYVTTGWGEKTSSGSHNLVRQTITMIDKDLVTAYDEWPDDYTEPKDIVKIEVTEPTKVTYQYGETVDLTGGYITVYYYDGTTEKLPLTAEGVEVQEYISTPDYYHTIKFPAPSTESLGTKYIRVTYKKFADYYTMEVIGEIPEHVHSLELVPEVPAQIALPGVKAYYSCACGEKFLDAEGKTAVTDDELVIPALEGNFEIVVDDDFTGITAVPEGYITGANNSAEDVSWEFNNSIIANVNRDGSKAASKLTLPNVMKDGKSFVMSVDMNLRALTPELWSSFYYRVGSNISLKCLYNGTELKINYQKASTFVAPAEITINPVEIANDGSNANMTLKIYHLINEDGSVTLRLFVNGEYIGYALYKDVTIGSILFLGTSYDEKATGYGAYQIVYDNVQIAVEKDAEPEQPDVHVHNLKHTAEVPATCAKNGMKEYWYCADCDTFYDSAEAKMPVAYLSLTILAHGLEYTAEVPATCSKTGVKEHWYCKTCDVYYDNADGLYPIAYLSLTILPHELKHVEEVPATCTKNGVKEYWYCATCDVFYDNAEGMYPIAYLSLTIPAHELKHEAEVWNGCAEKGMKEYWYCATCDVYYEDAECTKITNRLSLVISHSVEHHAEEWKGCAEQGMKEYWYCSTCDVYYADAACTIVTNAKDLVISHSVESKEKVWNGCLNGGMEAYWYCSTCDVYYADAACTVVTNAKNLVIPAHTVKHVEKVEATATENGMMEHWYCEECDVYYADAECKQVTNAKNLTIEATGNAETGDNSAIFMMIAVAIVAATSVTALVITKKRFF